MEGIVSTETLKEIIEKYDLAVSNKDQSEITEGWNFVIEILRPYVQKEKLILYIQNRIPSDIIFYSRPYGETLTLYASFEEFNSEYVAQTLENKKSRF